MDAQEFRSLQEAYEAVYENQQLDEVTAMAKRGYDETKLRKRAGGGEAADRATALEKKPTYGDAKKAKQRSEYARKQRGDFRNTASSSPGLHGYGHQSNDPKVKAKQAARGAQRGALTPAEKKQLNMEMEFDIFDVILEHLVAEGYADTNEAALAIMANMSEEWKQSIVEQASTVSSSGGAGGKVTVNKSYPATLNNQKGVKSTGPTGTEYFTPNFPGSNVPNRAESKFKSVASQQYEKVPSDQRTMDLNKPVSVTDRTKYDPSYKPPGMRK